MLRSILVLLVYYRMDKQIVDMNKKMRVNSSMRI